MANVKSEIPEFTREPTPISHEQLKRELAYICSTRILGIMVDQGLITVSECNQIDHMNRDSFSPAWAQILSDIR